MKVVAFVRTTNIYDDSRATKEIIALCEAGYKVIALGWNRNGKANKKCNEVFSNYDVDFCFFERPLKSGIGFRNIRMLIEWFRWTKKIIKNNREILAIHACNLDSVIGVLGISKKRNISIIYDIYDYYIDSHRIPSVLVKLVNRLEHIAINRAVATIICTEERIVQLERANPKEVVVIYNSPDVNELFESEIEYDYCYCGSLCERRLIREIVDEYKNHTDLKFIFAGNDVYYDKVSDISELYDNFFFKGTIPYDDVLAIEAKSRIISAIYEPSIRNHRLCAPNKFYEALALSKPVIVCRDTGIDKVVEKNQIGIVIDYDAHQFFDAISLLKNDEDMCVAMGKRARKLYEEKYQWILMRDKLVELYNRII